MPYLQIIRRKIHILFFFIIAEIFHSLKVKWLHGAILSVVPWTCPAWSPACADTHALKPCPHAPCPKLKGKVPTKHSPNSPNLLLTPPSSSLRVVSCTAWLEGWYCRPFRILWRSSTRPCRRGPFQGPENLGSRILRCQDRTYFR